MDNIVQKYAAAIQKEYAVGNTVEHSFRPALKTLLDELNPGYMATNEQRRTNVGSPDFVITHNKKPIGYGEVKDIGIDLNKIEKSDQLQGYMSLDNLFLSDYLEFRFFFNDKKYETVSIGRVENKKIVFNESKFEQLARMLKEFTDKNPITITSSLELTKLMANKAKLVKEIIFNAINGDHDNDNLSEQHKAFKEVLLHNMSKEEFADMYAQTITYGFFIARFFDKTLEDFSRHEAQELVPKSNPFLRQFFQIAAGADLDERVRWVVDDLASLFGYCDISKIMDDFKKKNGQKIDPVIHFYENFLAEYDPKLRAGRGVYYTPRPVVSFIVRSVDEILKIEFGLSDGLADTSKKTITTKSQGKTKKERVKKEEVHKVQILDPAVGTGTFLNEVIKHIRKKFEGQEGMWNGYVNEHLIPRLYGFELMMAPYTICHLTLGMALKKAGYESKNERLNVFLTNSLEPHDKDYETLFASWLSEESNKASRIKNEKPIMVVMGNPPYAVSSSNKGEWIRNLLKEYKQDLNERKTSLDDDYIKFIRYGQHYIEKNGEGVLAYITNNSFIDGVTHRQMRKSLLEAFDKIYILDLHGNSKKKEKAPDGGKDENVFDIMQGVSINFFIKTKTNSKKLADVYHHDLYGERDVKYKALDENSIVNIEWDKLDYKEPEYFFVKQNIKNRNYLSFFQVQKLFKLYSTGVQTSRDDIAHSFTKLEQTLKNDEFKDLSIDDGTIREKYFKKTSSKYQKGDTRDWNLSENRQKAVGYNLNNEIISYSFRPFDSRYLTYNDIITSWTRKEVGRHLLQENYSLIIARSSSDSHFSSIFCSRFISDVKCGERTKGSIFLPLYLYPDENSPDKIRTPNLNSEIVADIEEAINLKFVNEKAKDNSTSFSPINIFDYIYAVLHSPLYREKYQDFLKTDFPRVPYPKDEKQFFALAKIGEELRQLHLLESPKVNKFITKYSLGGDDIVEKIRYEDGNVFINDKQYFGDVPEVTWNFYIGGYQPAQKWLKDRKGRKLSNEDIAHYQKMIIALSETERLMGEIDKVFKG